MPTPTISQSIAITGVSDLVPVPSGFSKSSSDDFVFAETDFSGFFSLADLPLIPHSLHYFFLDSTGLRRIIPFMLFQLEPFFPIFVVFSFFVSFSFPSFIVLEWDCDSLSFHLSAFTKWWIMRIEGVWKNGKCDDCLSLLSSFCVMIHSSN